MKKLLLAFLLVLSGCTNKTNQAYVVHTMNGGKGVDATCSTHVNDCYRLIQNTCQSSYHILFIQYTSMLEYTITVSCNKF
jgi:hypothetical protein